MDERLAQSVRERAGHACEYCRVPQLCYPTVTFPMDHIIARQHRGSTELGNLALSCLHCNSFKGPNIAGVDPKTRRLTRLFNPRRNRWSRHFRWSGPLIVGRTPVGRVTVEVLNMNDREAVTVRASLIDEGMFPPVE
jgi:HNH endonuclease